MAAVLSGHQPGARSRTHNHTARSRRWRGRADRFVEVDPVPVEGLACGVRPGAYRRPEALRGQAEVRPGWLRPATRRKAPAPAVGEDHAVGIVGITFDAELAEVVEPMSA